MVKPTSWLLVAGLALLSLAWLVSDPPSAAPDEPAHYIKALGAGSGDLLGSPGHYATGLDNGPQLAFFNQLVRGFHVPANLAPPAPCFAHLPAQSAACLPTSSNPPLTELSYVGRYEPFLYILPGMLMRAARDTESAYLLGRLGFAILNLLLLGSAILLLRGAGAEPRLAGVLLAITPMAIFLSSSINPSGPEICASIAFTALLLKQSHEGGRHQRLWIGIAFAGAVLALSRPLSFIWLLLALSLLLALEGPERLRAMFRAGGRTALIGAGVDVLAVLLAIGWTVAFQQPARGSLGDLPARLLASWNQVPELLLQAVGSFGWLDTPLPHKMYWLWLGLTLALLLVAFLLAGWRQRAVLLGILATALAALMAESAVVLMPTGFMLQGRYVLPAAVMAPLLAGEIVYRRRQRMPSLAWALAWALVAAAVAGEQLMAWLVNGHRFAVGTQGRLNFIVHPQWSPPGGWVLCLLLAVLGASALLASGLGTLRWRQGEEAPRSAESMVGADRVAG
jgi:hypothetical protein